MWKKICANNDLKRHMKVHSEKPIQRKDCKGKSLESLPQLITLNNKKCQPSNRNELGNNRKHICDICSKHFSTDGNLTRHMKVHTGVHYKCKNCERVFTQGVDLKRHMKTHSEEKIIQCKNSNIPKQEIINHVVNVSKGEPQSTRKILLLLIAVTYAMFALNIFLQIWS